MRLSQDLMGIQRGTLKSSQFDRMRETHSSLNKIRKEIKLLQDDHDVYGNKADV
jgi:hypothetical protein